MDVKGLLLDALAGTLEAVEESAIVAGLQHLHESDVDTYKAVVYCGYAFAKGLSKWAVSTPNKIDDAVYASIMNAVKTSAAANNIELV